MREASLNDRATVPREVVELISSGPIEWSWTFAMMPSPRNLRTAASNLARKLAHGRLADLRPTPMEVVDEAPGRAVHRYRGPRELIAAGPPVLFVPPPAAPTRCYDLRRGGSLAEHLVNTGRRSYLLDQRPDGEWGTALPAAIEAVSRDAGGQPVQLVGWSLGGVMALLAAAADPAPPVASVTLVAAPADPGAASRLTASIAAGRSRARRRRWRGCCSAALRDAWPSPPAACSASRNTCCALTKC
jgi:pimeloyl-ACP methyl ester carboxylesterase